MLKQIRYFQAVVRLGSFSKAAEECFISQSAISQQIKTLERELGVRLLKRENRSFSLTPAGKNFYEKSLSIIADLDQLYRETKQIAAGENFALRIGYLRGYSGDELKRTVAEFATRYPDIPIDVCYGNHEDLYEWLRTGRVDLVLNDQRRAFSDAYVNTVLTTVGCHIEISSRNPIALLPCVEVGELRQTPCILVSSKGQRDNERSYYREIYGIEGKFLFAETLDEARLMVISGKGYLPLDGVAPPNQFTDVITSLPLCRSGKPIHRNYCAFWKADNGGNYIEKFAEILKAQF